MLEVVKTLRSGEGYLPSNCARTKRILCLNGEWFFLTRESKTPLGPYADQKQMLAVASDYVSFAAVADNKLVERCFEHLSKAG